MSDYGVFEASTTDGHEEEQAQRQAKRDLGRAIEAAREGFGTFLGSATDKQDYQDRLALVMNDLMQKVADSGVMPVPGVMRKVKAALRPEFRLAHDFKPGDKVRANGKDGRVSDVKGKNSDADIYVAFSGEGVDVFRPSQVRHAASRKQGSDYLQELKEWHPVEYAAFMESLSPGVVYEPGEMEQLHKQWAATQTPFDEGDDFMASRRQAAPGFDENISDEDLLASIEIAKLFQDNQDKVDELEAEARSRGILSSILSFGSRKHANDSAKGDAINFIQYLQSLGYRMPKDVGYPGADSELDEELYIYFKGDLAKIQEVTEFLQQNWDYYAYGASRKQAAGLDEFENMLRANWGASFSEFLNEFDEDSQRDAREEFKNTFGVTDADLNGFLPAIGASRKAGQAKGSRRKIAVEWRFDDLGLGDLDWKSWWTVPEESAQASNGVQGLVVEDGSGKGGYNWLIQDVATSDDLQRGNAPSVEEAKSAVEQAMSRYASRKQAGDAESVDAVVDFLLFCDKEGFSSESENSLDVYNGDDEISQDDYNTIYDFIAGDLDDYLYSKIFDRYRQRTSSRKQSGAGNWEQAYDGAGQWKLKDNSQVVIEEEEDGYYLFNGVDLIEFTDTLEQAMELGESSHVASRKQASDVDLDDHRVLVWLSQFEDQGLEPSAPGEEQWEWLKDNVDYDVIQDSIDQAYEYGELGRADAHALAYELQQTFFGSRKQASDDALVLDAISDLMLNGTLSVEDKDAIERAYGQGEQGKWEAAYNSVTFVADGPDLGSWEDGLVEAILDGIEDLLGRTASRKQAEDDYVTITPESAAIDFKEWLDGRTPDFDLLDEFQETYQYSDQVGEAENNAMVDVIDRFGSRKRAFNTDDNYFL